MKTPLHIRSDHLTIVQHILDKHLPPSTTVWFFGSRVKGNVKKYSDLDLAIDANGKTLPSDIMIDLAADFEESDLPFKVDILDWNTISESFKETIKNDRVLMTNVKAIS